MLSVSSGHSPFWFFLPFPLAGCLVYDHHDWLENPS